MFKNMATEIGENVQVKANLNHLLEMQDAPITSDHQQFERLKYLEKELDRLRDKVEGIK
jgi:cell fate (sporulation/competence/biofilm development) regulator YmcA (YheA/YmcA/DUF963 family)